jgi:di/tricarboxylate transporter
MMPGVYLFRTASGFAQMTADAEAPVELVSHTLFDGFLAATIVLAMCLSLLVPNLVLTDLSERTARLKSG